MMKAFALGVLALASGAHATITFEELGDGVAVSSQYSALGILFSTTGGGSASTSSYSAYFGTKAVCNATAGGAGADRKLSIFMDFSTPIDLFEFDYHTAGDPGADFPYRMYSGGGLVASGFLTESAGGGGSWTRDKILSGVTFDRLEIDSGGGSGWLYALDNIDFHQVPAPGNLALLGVGALAAARRRR